MARIDAHIIFSALGDPTRLAIVELLAQQEKMRISDVATRFPITRQAVTRHLKCLSEAGVIRMERQGREQIASLDPGSFRTVADWASTYNRFWSAKLGDLKTIIETRERS